MNKFLVFIGLVILVTACLLIIPAKPRQSVDNPLPFNLECPLIVETLPESINLALVKNVSFLSAQLPHIFACSARNIVASASCQNIFIQVDNGAELSLQFGEGLYDPNNLDEAPDTYIFNLPQNRPDVAAWFMYEALQCHSANTAYDLANLSETNDINLPDSIDSADLYRFVVITYFNKLQGQEECKREFQRIIDGQSSVFEINTALHRQQVEWAQSLCTKSDEELYKIATSYMDEDDPRWHAVIAYYILTQIRSKDDKVRDQISKSEQKVWPEL